MPLSDTNHWSTAIAKVESDDVIVRGERLTELIGRLTYSEMMYLVLTGHRASRGQARVLDALMVSVMDHGISPSTLVARMFASYGVPIQAGIAAGVLTFGDIHGGAGQHLAQTLAEAVAEAAEEGAVTDEALRAVAARMIEDSTRERRPIEGFGHPQHGADPRVPILFGLAREEGVFSHHSALLTHLEAELERAKGRRIPANIDGASASLLLDLGLDPQYARLMLVAPRTVGLAAHFVEEREQGNAWRHVPNAQVEYTGRSASE